MSKFFITIDEPCEQNWNEMTPVANGRFCSNCSKEVIDFSTSSDNEIIAYIGNNKGKLLCGNFEPEQLNRWLETSRVKTTNPILYKVLAGMFLLTASQNTIAQQTKIPMPDTVLQQKRPCSDSADIVSVPKTNTEAFNAQFHFRGLVSLKQDTLPMLIVDGAPTPMIWLDKIPADKIKSKVVLKGVTAATIYGPEAANGVIIIATNFTKRKSKHFFRNNKT